MFEKDRQNVEEAAKHLKRMLTHFPNDSWKEIENIVDQLQVKTRILNEDCVKHCITCYRFFASIVSNKKHKL